MNHADFFRSLRAQDFMFDPAHETFYALRLIFAVGITWHLGKEECCSIAT